MTSLGMEHDHNHSEYCSGEKPIIDIFAAVKSGILIAVQEMVMAFGEDVLNTYDGEGNTPAHYACEKGYKLIVEFIIESEGWFNEISQNGKGQRPIHVAAFEGHCAIVDLILQQGVPVDIQDKRGRTPLIYSAQGGKCSVAAFLIAKGASKMIRDNEGDGPLHWAAYNGHAEMVRMLVYFGYDPDQADLHYQKPIHLSSLKGNLEVVRDLCNIDKVNITDVDENGSTPMALSLKKNHFNVSFFLKQVLRRNKKLSMPTTFRSLLDGSFMTEAQNRLFIFLIGLIILFGYPTYVYEFVFTTWNDLFLLHLWFFVSNVLFWIAFIKTHRTDPGIIAQDDDQYTWLMQNIASYKEIENASVTLSRLCHSCRIVKPLRSKHCRVCNRCIEVFDHHCFYVGNCIGLKNRVWFVIFVLTSIIIGIISIAFCYHHHVTDQEDVLIFIGCAIMGGLTGLASIVFMCIISTINSGLTTNERANWHRYHYLKDAKGRLSNPYNRGFLHNLLDYLHIKHSKTSKDLEAVITAV